MIKQPPWHRHSVNLKKMCPFCVPKCKRNEIYMYLMKAKKIQREKKKNIGIYNCCMYDFPVVLHFSNYFVCFLYSVCTICYPNESNRWFYLLDFTLRQSTVCFFSRNKIRYVIQSWNLTITPPHLWNQRSSYETISNHQQEIKASNGQINMM